ncbi:hypothetical protein ABID56_000736 [Alkalibacillus flavidus]|uniref:Uncharacterized protein n=1 Tax=Alkalibacillus flavidus TaxID=546021 RepID=A0ABV2KSU7_9BACI
MERIIMIVSSIVLVATWAIVIMLFISESQTTYMAKDHNISGEMSLSMKSNESLWVMYDEAQQAEVKKQMAKRESTYEELSERFNQITNEFESIDDSSLDPWRDYFTSEDDNKGTVSISELLNIFSPDEAVSES